MSAARPGAGRLSGAVVWVAVLSYAALWFRLGVWRYDVFRASYDDGVFTQVLSSAFSAFRARPEFNFNHLATHFSPDLFLLAPLVVATHSTLTMIAAQALAGGLVAPPLYFIARRRMPDALAAGCALVALLYPPLAGVTFADFHENGIEPAAIVWLLWAVDSGRMWTSLIVGLFALGIKEDVAPGMFAGGLAAGVWLLRRGDAARARIAFALSACAAAAFAAYLAVLRPALHAPFPFQQFRFYNGDDSGAPDPGGALRRLRYVVDMLLPLAFVPLLSPVAFCLALPGLLEILASRNPITMSLETHYAAVWIGYMLFAYVCGLSTIARRSRRAAALVLAVSAALCLFVQIKLDPSARWYALYRAPGAHDATLQAMLDALPPDAAISAPDRIYAHLGFDPNADVAPGGRFVILDRTNNDVTPQWAQYEAELPGLVSAGTYRLVRSVDGIELYEKNAP